MSPRSASLGTIAQGLIEHARKVYAGGSPDLMPLCHAETKGRAVVLGLPWDSPEAKRQVLQALRSIFQGADVDAYCIMSEAWMATYDKGTQPYSARKPSEREDRVEVLTVGGGDREGRRIMITLALDRDADGRPSVGKVLLDSRDDPLPPSGDLTTLLE